MSNLYFIEQELLDIFDTLEDNGGELTPELEARLSIAQEDFKDKIENYTHVISKYNADINFIKAEQKRLKELADAKAKVVERLSKIMIEAIDKFGDEKPKSKVKFVDFGTGVVSVRNSKAVQLDDDTLERVDNALEIMLKDLHLTNSLDVINKLNTDELIILSAKQAEDDGQIHPLTGISPNDLDYMDVEVSAKIPLKKILSGEEYPAIRELMRNNNIKHKTSASKSFLKGELEQNGSCAPNLARLVTNKSISIK